MFLLETKVYFLPGVNLGIVSLFANYNTINNAFLQTYIVKLISLRCIYLICLQLMVKNTTGRRTLVATAIMFILKD